MGVSGPWPNERPSRAIFFIEFRVRISAERQFGTIPLWDEWRAWGHGVCRSGPRETVGLARAKRRADWWVRTSCMHFHRGLGACEKKEIFVLCREGRNLVGTTSVRRSGSLVPFF